MEAAHVLGQHARIALETDVDLRTADGQERVIDDLAGQSVELLCGEVGDGRRQTLPLTHIDLGGHAEVGFEVRHDLYRFQVANKVFDGFIKLLLRAYTGLFTEFVSINESFLAQKAKLSEEAVKRYLEKLNSLKIIQYIPLKK